MGGDSEKIGKKLVLNSRRNLLEPEGTWVSMGTNRNRVRRKENNGVFI